MANTFQILLNHLDPDEDVAANEYLILREKITKTAEWRGVSQSYADDVADVVLERVAEKIEKGEKVKNINSYALAVLRFVVLEYFRKTQHDIDVDEPPELSFEPEFEEENDIDLRTKCLRRCLQAELSDDKSKLIMRYYDTEEFAKIKDNRKNLAEELEITYNNLKVTTRRIRELLRKCINECMSKETVTNSPNSDTNKQGGI